MHDPDAPPRLRWRLLAWGVGAVILLPVLYVAAAGPMAWRVSHHYFDPPWYKDYERSLKPLYQSPQFASMMRAYCRWWEKVPPPRSWERMKIEEEIQYLKYWFQDTYLVEQHEQEYTARVEGMMNRLQALLNQPETQPGRDEEIAQLKAGLEIVQKVAAASQYVSAKQTRAVVEGEIQAAEQRLRQLDAQ